MSLIIWHSDVAGKWQCITRGTLERNLTRYMRFSVMEVTRFLALPDEYSSIECISRYFLAPAASGYRIPTGSESDTGRYVWFQSR